MEKKNTLTENQRARKNQLLFLSGRQYEQMAGEKKANKKYIHTAYKSIMKRFPSYRKPDDGSGDEDSFNAGFNAAIDELSKIVLEEIIKNKGEI